MNPRQRVIEALNHRVTDMCPYYIWIHKDMVQPIADHYGNPTFREDYIIDHSVMTEVTSAMDEHAGGKIVDEFGCVWRQGAALHLEEPALSGATLSGYSFPDLTTPEHYSHIDEWSKRYHDRFRIVQLGMMFFERAWMLRGFENLFMDIYDRPGFVDELFGHLESACNSIIDRLLANFADSIDAIGFSEDYGSEQNVLISPDIWQRHLSPFLERMFRRIHAGGKYVYLHCCGHVEPLVPVLIDLGVDMLQPIQPEANDIYKLKQLYGQKIVFVGGIGTQRVLPFGTPQQVRDEVREALRRMNVDGGYVLAPAKPILPGVPLENAVALIDSIVRQ